MDEQIIRKRVDSSGLSLIRLTRRSQSIEAFRAIEELSVRELQAHGFGPLLNNNEIEFDMQG